MFLFSYWRETPLQTRIKIAEVLGIPKTGPTHVQNNVVESDGYAIKDIETALNVDRLMAYLNTDEIDLATLFRMLVDRMNGILPPMVEVEEKFINDELVEVKANGIEIYKKEAEEEKPKKVRKVAVKKASVKKSNKNSKKNAE